MPHDLPVRVQVDGDYNQVICHGEQYDIDVCRCFSGDSIVDQYDHCIAYQPTQADDDCQYKVKQLHLLIWVLVGNTENNTNTLIQ